MQKINHIMRFLTGSVLLTGLLMSFTACSEQSPLQSYDDSAVTRVAAGDLHILKSLNGPSLNKAFIKQQVIKKSKGGLIEVGDKQHGKSSLNFPKDAVSEDVEVTFEWESTGFLEGGAQFSPHGTVFLKPVEIKLSYKDADLTGINEADLKIWYFNEDLGVWELVGDEVHPDQKYVRGYINHFSRYAIGAE